MVEGVDAGPVLLLRGGLGKELWVSVAVWGVGQR